MVILDTGSFEVLISKIRYVDVKFFQHYKSVGLRRGANENESLLKSKAMGKQIPLLSVMVLCELIYMKRDIYHSPSSRFKKIR